MTRLNVEEDEMMISYNLVTLFIKTPIKEACIVIREKLNKDKSLKKRTKLPVDNIIQLLEFVLNTTYFRLGGVIY